MKILHVIATMDPASGGPSQGLRNIIPVHKSMGARNEVLSFDSPQASFLEKDDFTIHAIGPSKGPYAYCPNLVTWLDNNLSQFEVVLIHGIWLYNSYGTFKYLKNYRKQHKVAPRLFVMPHGMLDPYFQNAPDRKFKAIRNWIFWKLIEHRVINGANAILFTCEQELILARKTFSNYHPKLEINVGYGIATPPDFEPEMSSEFLKRCTSVTGKPYLLYLSRIHIKKGVDLLINAYIKLKKEGLDLPHLVVAGPGTDTLYGKQMQQLAVDTPSIIFPGMLTGAAKWGAFYGAEAFVLPSHQENFGIVVAESLACGTPVLISDQVNIWKEITDGGAGIVAPDTASGTYELIKAWQNKTKLEKIGLAKAAKLVFVAKFMVQEVGGRLLAVLTETM